MNFRKPEEIVEGLGAVQAQDYSGGLWEVGLRLPGSNVGNIEKALIDRKIVRTGPMRGTLHSMRSSSKGPLRHPQ
jgi:hypothetical protein